MNFTNTLRVSGAVNVMAGFVLCGSSLSSSKSFISSLSNRTSIDAALHSGGEGALVALLGALELLLSSESDSSKAKRSLARVAAAGDVAFVGMRLWMLYWRGWDFGGSQSRKFELAACAWALLECAAMLYYSESLSKRFT
jgi:hypothetical protein